MMKRYLWTFTVLLLIVGCTPEKPAGTGANGAGRETTSQAESGGGKVIPASAAGTYSMEITPAAPTRSSTLSLKTTGFRVGNAKIEWMVNGNIVGGENGATLQAGDLNRGDQVMARAVVNGKEVVSNAAEVANALPEIVNARIVPETTDGGQRLHVEAEAKDPDGDEVTLRYEWTKNGESAGEGEALDTALKKGDNITVKITPSDPWAQGSPVLLPVTIRNIPPVIRSNGAFHFDGKVWTYRVTATDPDGDPLTYALEGAPSGMTIDPETGAISWPVPADYTGHGDFKAIVRDDHGGESKLNLTFTITR